MRSACSALALLAWLAADLASAQSVRLLAQRSPLAGAQFHQLHAVRAGLREGDALTLEREPDNRHDRRAIRVLWRGHMLGYLPRAANFEAAAEMDAALLSDKLPPAAYGDPGFSEYLSDVEQPPAQQPSE